MATKRVRLERAGNQWRDPSERSPFKGWFLCSGWMHDAGHTNDPVDLVVSTRKPKGVTPIKIDAVACDLALVGGSRIAIYFELSNLLLSFDKFPLYAWFEED